MAIKRFVRHKEKQHFYLTPSIRSKRWEHTNTDEGFPLPSPLSLLVIVVAAFAVQSEASVIVVCILYFDKTFIYAKPRQWKHYSMWNPGCASEMAVIVATAHQQPGKAWGWKGCVNRSSSTLLVVILLLFSICYSKAIAGCLADESRILLSTLASRENGRL